MPEQKLPEAVVVITEPFEGPAVERWTRLITDAVDLSPYRLVVDVRDSALVDAAALEVLLRAHRDMIRRDGRLTLRGPTPRVRRILRLAHLEDVFDVDDGVSAVLPSAAV